MYFYFGILFLEINYERSTLSNLQYLNLYMKIFKCHGILTSKTIFLITNLIIKSNSDNLMFYN